MEELLELLGAFLTGGVNDLEAPPQPKSRFFSRASPSKGGMKAPSPGLLLVLTGPSSYMEASVETI